ncbi:MAG TPA: LuxR C-terminal-related transcriptional regulator [Kribbellaceae bacterium]|nr:LuxR C-terminal-related transcriptional regulator [Kribbellaceae bacterium]
MTTVGAAKNADVTAREAEVLALIARHLTNAQIAEALFISPRTVETHVSALLRKLGLPDRRSLARHAEAIPGLLVSTGRPGLPAPVTPFVGRHAEQEALVAALREHRMVTATGPGGVGKTRLALNVAASTAASYRDGAWFVDLVHLTDPALVTAAVAQTLGVPEQGTGSTEQALVAALAGRDALVVLDNCEHVLDGVRDCVERILAGCPDVRVLATSRTRLLGPYESVYAVPGLSDEDSVALFAARSGAASEFDARRVTALCEALDGIALAIELAAARYATLGLDGLEAGLDERLRFLTGRARPGDRHRSLRDAIAWSYDLLTPDHRSLLRSVAVFAAWFDVEAAHVVTGTGRAFVADGLARLAEHSLLVVEPGTPTRYRALETIRQYGAEQLELAGELDQARTAHERWCRGVVAALREAEPDDAWCARFDQVVDDLGAALVWSAATAGADELAADLAGLLFMRGWPAQAQHRYQQATALAGTTAARLRYLRLAAGAAASRFAGADILRLLRSAADLAIETGDGPGAVRDLATMAMYIARSPGIMSEPHPPEEAVALLEEARLLSDASPGAEAALATAEAFVEAAVEPGRVEPARRAVALAEQAGDGISHSAALDVLCSELLAVHDIPGAVEVIRRRTEVMRPLGVSAITGYEVVDVHLMASDVYLAAGDLAGAGDNADLLARLPFYRDEPHLRIARRIKVDALAGALEDVVRNGERFRAGWQRAGRPVATDLGAAAHAVAMVHGILGDEDRRSAWLEITVAVGVAAERLAGCVTGWAPVFDALLALHRDDPGAALDRLSADPDDPVWRRWGSGLWRPWYAALWAEAAVLAGHRDAAVRIERSRHAARDNPIAAAVVERAAAVAARDHDQLVRFAITFAQLGCPYQQARTGRLAAGSDHTRS